MLTMLHSHIHTHTRVHTNIHKKYKMNLNICTYEKVLCILTQQCLNLTDSASL
jgi:hypothetical protein